MRTLILLAALLAASHNPARAADSRESAHVPDFAQVAAGMPDCSPESDCTGAVCGTDLECTAYCLAHPSVFVAATCWDLFPTLVSPREVYP